MAKYCISEGVTRFVIRHTVCEFSWSRAKVILAWAVYVCFVWHLPAQWFAAPPYLAVSKQQNACESSLRESTKVNALCTLCVASYQPSMWYVKLKVTLMILMLHRSVNDPQRFKINASSSHPQPVEVKKPLEWVEKCLDICCCRLYSPGMCTKSTI